MGYLKYIAELFFGGKAFVAKHHLASWYGREDHISMSVLSVGMSSPKLSGSLLDSQIGCAALVLSWYLLLQVPGPAPYA